MKKHNIHTNKLFLFRHNNDHSNLLKYEDINNNGLYNKEIIKPPNWQKLEIKRPNIELIFK